MSRKRTGGKNECRIYRIYDAYARTGELLTRRRQSNKKILFLSWDFLSFSPLLCQFLPGFSVNLLSSVRPSHPLCLVESMYSVVSLSFFLFCLVSFFGAGLPAEISWRDFGHFVPFPNATQFSSQLASPPPLFFSLASNHSTMRCITAHESCGFLPFVAYNSPTHWQNTKCLRRGRTHGPIHARKRGERKEQAGQEERKIQSGSIAAMTIFEQDLISK